MNKPKRVEKDWGYELWLANNEEEDYCGKILYIKADCFSSLHFHSKKHETFYILEGRLKVEMVNTLIGEKVEYLLKEGETFEIERNDPHKLIAHKGPVKFIEISTFHEDADSFKISR
jgi:mannose-6-phosphate isomerase-like protein (cupin superfamily)